ncbi:uncharacterized protein LOC125945183 [Dermacentor silvarum]|uniref:uncharacterized protein LOC125945183 n=1 Tax=Dermacentor silvarum TaxID=543639 RepID=UPI002101A498|nr:uncharacterized protein LOC125945183 [Dermacentor silvarum]
MIAAAKYPSLITSVPRNTNAMGMFGANWQGRTSGRREDVRDSMNSSKMFPVAKADVDPGGGQPTDGAVNQDHEGAPTIISASAVAPISETAGHLTGTTDQQQTALREMANLPTLLDRLLNPLRKRAYFGSITLRMLSPWSTSSTTPSPFKNRSWSFSALDKCRQGAVTTILLVVMVLAVYSLIWYTGGSGGGGTSGGGPMLCQTTDCVRHADLFADRLNASIDPCEDFAAFVCSAWTYGTPHRRDDVTSMRQEIVLRFTENFAGTIATGLT